MFEQLIDDTDILQDVYEVITSWDTERYWGEYESNTYDKIYPAYDAEELLSMLEHGFDIHFYPDKSIGILHYEHYNKYEFNSKSLTEVLGDLLIFQLENKITTIEGINKMKITIEISEEIIDSLKQFHGVSSNEVAETIRRIVTQAITKEKHQNENI